MDAFTKRKMRIGIWAVDLPGRSEPDPAGVREVVVGLLGAGNEVFLVAGRWDGGDMPGLEVKTTAPRPPMPRWAAAAFAALTAVRRAAGRARRRLADLRARKDLLLTAPLVPLAPLLLLAGFCYRALLFSSRRLFRRLEGSRRRRGGAVAATVAGARCDVWLVSSALTAFTFPPGVRCAWLLDGPPNRPAAPPADDYRTESRLDAQLRHACFETTLFLVHSREFLSGPCAAGWAPVQDRHRVVPVGDPAAWHAVLAEAAALPLSAGDLAAARGDRPHVHLFMPDRYRGGVWEATRTLLAGLDAVNRDRGSPLEITAAFLPGQPGLGELAAGLPGVRFEWLTRQLLPGPDGGPRELPWSPSALDADAWFSLIDRFRPPLLAARPVGVMVYDVIQRHLPEVFPASFHEEYVPAMRATVSRAECVVTTNPVTRLDAAEEYGLAADRVSMIPVACEPAKKFGGPARRAAPPVPAGCLLNVTNATPHKGMPAVLRGYARLREKLGGRGPGLVFCGHNTDRVAPSYAGPDEPGWRRTRRLIRELGLVPGRDIWLLGYVDDDELRALYEHSGAVINAARYDNGTFSLIEARYFGKPLVCSRYPAAVALYDHFGIPVHYFGPDDDDGLAEAVLLALARPTLAGEELDRCRAALADPRFGHRRHAERVYELLFDLARRGREAARRAA